jgi:predicted RNase H-related nuclease YkuK (DUF458 family)
MNHVFKSYTNLKPINLIQYILDYVQKYPDVSIHIGTDSQNIGIETVYVTTVVLRLGSRGGHVLYSRVKMPIIKDFWTKLWKEVELSVEVAQFITHNTPLKIHSIDLDYNSDEFEDSYKLVAASKGWVTSLGFKATVKPEEQIASKASDHIIRADFQK